jgi:predicted dehydrogenase
MRVIDSAQRNNLLLSVDFSYRHLEGIEIIRNMMHRNAIGHVFAAECVFHNAYGPDKDWFYDPERAGGGCCIDLGIHLADLILYIFDFPSVHNVNSALYHAGQRLRSNTDKQVEDFADITFDLETGTHVHMTCSWRLPAGQDAVIALTLYGTGGALSFRNKNGSFYDFITERYIGTSKETLHDSIERWGGRAISRWAREVADGKHFDPQVLSVIEVASLIDRIYGRNS